MTEHVASDCPLTRKPSSHQSLLGLTGWLRTRIDHWPLGFLYVHGQSHHKRSSKGETRDGRTLTHPLQAVGCSIRAESARPDKIVAWRQMTDKIDAIVCSYKSVYENRPHKHNGYKLRLRSVVD